VHATWRGFPWFGIIISVGLRRVKQALATLPVLGYNSTTPQRYREIQG
jgi:hypothetical protein